MTGIIGPVDGSDPLDDQDDLYSALATGAGTWTLRDSRTGETVPVTREQLGQLLADNRRRLADQD